MTSAGRTCPRRPARRVMGDPVTRDVRAPADPDVLMPRDVIQEALERLAASGPAAEPAVQADRHHLRRVFAFPIETVEGRAQVVRELGGGRKAIHCRKAHVVAIEGVRNDEVSFSAHALPVRQVIRIRIRVVEKPAVLDHEPAGIGTVSTRIPAHWPLAS